VARRRDGVRVQARIGQVAAQELQHALPRERGRRGRGGLGPSGGRSGPNPWQGQTLEWATSSPPPPFNFNLDYPVPRVHSYAPLLDAREQAEARQQAAGGRNGPPAEQAGPGPAPTRGGQEA